MRVGHYLCKAFLLPNGKRKLTLVLLSLGQKLKIWFHPRRIWSFCILKTKANIMGKANHPRSFLRFDEYISIFDKVVDSTWNEQAVIQKLQVSKG
ncbi:hypothetical protein LINPERHAP1_LOCUS29183 [Linum perenne]